MDKLAFEHACFSSTLRTPALRPTDTLGSERRLPSDAGDELLHTARPTWIGKNYQVGGVPLIGKNPAGGTASHQSHASRSDPGLAEALRRLARDHDLRAYRIWRDEAQPRAMQTWRIWRVSVMAIVDKLKPAIKDLGEIDLAMIWRGSREFSSFEQKGDRRPSRRKTTGT